jgi:hypothetical protein
MEKKKSINDIDPYGDSSEISRDIPEENITSEQIEQSEKVQKDYEKQKGEGSFEGVSNSHMDPEHRGNLGVKRSSQTQYEKEKYNKEAEKVSGGPDTGAGRASGSDRA